MNHTKEFQKKEFEKYNREVPRIFCSTLYLSFFSRNKYNGGGGVEGLDVLKISQILGNFPKWKIAASAHQFYPKWTEKDFEKLLANFQKRGK